MPSPKCPTIHTARLYLSQISLQPLTIVDIAERGTIMSSDRTSGASFAAAAKLDLLAVHTASISSSVFAISISETPASFKAAITHSC